MTRIDRSRLVLWSQSSQVIQSYGSPSAAYGLMFLFSGRGYWQAIIWAHKVVVAAHVLVGFRFRLAQAPSLGVGNPNPQWRPLPVDCSALLHRLGCGMVRNTISWQVPFVGWRSRCPWCGLYRYVLSIASTTIPFPHLGELTTSS